MLTPGAIRSHRDLPKLEKLARWSFWSEAATVTMFATFNPPGAITHPGESMLKASFPAAATKTIPASRAFSMASCRAALAPGPDQLFDRIFTFELPALFVAIT